MKLFFFESTNKRDKLSQLTIRTSSRKRAYALAVINFVKNGYKGSPREI